MPPTHALLSRASARSHRAFWVCCSVLASGSHRADGGSHRAADHRGHDDHPKIRWRSGHQGPNVNTYARSPGSLGSPVFANAVASGLIGGSLVPGLAATKRRRISVSMLL